MYNNGVFPDNCKYMQIQKQGKLTIFGMYFDSVSDVERFLSSNPTVNDNIFISQHSIDATEEFAGPPIEEAIKYCIIGYNEHFDRFMSMYSRLQSMNSILVVERSVESAFVGHRPNVPAYIADAPKCMYRNKKYVQKKVINVCMQATYESSTGEKEILHRGILVLNLLKVLEMNGYIVQFRLFEASALYNEVFTCEIVLKKQGDKVDPRKMFYPLCGKGFVRRVLVRIKESMPFQGNWYMGYGSVLKEKDTRRLLNMQPDDIYIDTPRACGIRGKNIYEDADAFLRKLGLENKIHFPNYSENVYME